MKICWTAWSQIWMTRKETKLIKESNNNNNERKKNARTAVVRRCCRNKNGICKWRNLLYQDQGKMRKYVSQREKYFVHLGVENSTLHLSSRRDLRVCRRWYVDSVLSWKSTTFSAVLERFRDLRVTHQRKRLTRNLEPLPVQIICRRFVLETNNIQSHHIPQNFVLVGLQ